MAINANSESTSNANDIERWEAIQANFARASKVLNSAGLAIGTTSKKKVKIVNTVCYLTAAGALATKASAEVTLAGTVVADKFNCWLLSMDDEGKVTATAGTDAATLAALAIPTVPTGEMPLGLLLVNPTGTGNFVGGTTDLDDATVVPNAVYVSFFDGSVLGNTLIS